MDNITIENVDINLRVSASDTWLFLIGKKELCGNFHIDGLRINGIEVGDTLLHADFDAEYDKYRIVFIEQYDFIETIIKFDSSLEAGIELRLPKIECGDGDD